MATTPFVSATSIGGSVGSSQIGYTAYYTYIDEALRQRWRSFCALRGEMQAFVPKLTTAWDTYRVSETTRMQAINPGKPSAEIAAFVDKQIEFLSSPNWQFHQCFDNRHMTEYVTVLMLAHALSEALINAALAIGLAQIGAADLFPLLERSDLKQKWLYGPKTFSPTYTFPVGTALNETLVYLVKQRNALVHHKIDLDVNGEKVLEGSGFRRQPYEAEQRWIERFYNLPYDLAGHLRQSVPSLPTILILDADPIARSAPA